MGILYAKNEDDKYRRRRRRRPANVWGMQQIASHNKLFSFASKITLQTINYWKIDFVFGPRVRPQRTAFQQTHLNIQIGIWWWWQRREARSSCSFFVCSFCSSLSVSIVLSLLQTHTHTQTLSRLVHLCVALRWNILCCRCTNQNHWNTLNETFDKRTKIWQKLATAVRCCCCCVLYSQWRKLHFSGMLSPDVVNLFEFQISCFL